MRYFGGCDAGSTYTKCVILDEAGRIAASVTSKSRIHPVKSAQAALDEAVSQVADLTSARDLAYLVGAIRCRLPMRIYQRSVVMRWGCIWQIPM